MNGIVLAVIVLCLSAAGIAVMLRHQRKRDDVSFKITRQLASARSHLLDMQAQREYYTAMSDYYTKQISRLERAAAKRKGTDK